MNYSEEARARSSRNDEVLDPPVGAVIESAVSESVGSLTDNLTKVIESRRFREAIFRGEHPIVWYGSSSVEQTVKRARREQYTCKRKGNQLQLNHSLQVLDKASDALKQKLYEKVKAALESGTELVSKLV